MGGPGRHGQSQVPAETGRQDAGCGARGQERWNDIQRLPLLRPPGPAAPARRLETHLELAPIPQGRGRPQLHGEDLCHFPVRKAGLNEKTSNRFVLLFSYIAD